MLVDYLPFAFKGCPLEFSCFNPRIILDNLISKRIRANLLEFFHGVLNRFQEPVEFCCTTFIQIDSSSIKANSVQRSFHEVYPRFGLEISIIKVAFADMS
jgi:hypothetical protein